MSIITSILDTDLYKLTMQKAYVDLFPEATGVFKFKNRGKQRFNKDFVKLLKAEIEEMHYLCLRPDEKKWLAENVPFLGVTYLDFLENYNFKPEEVDIKLTEDNDLDITIGRGSDKLYSTTMWEVPLMAIISELYFKTVDTNWNFSEQDYYYKTQGKGKSLTWKECKFGDFGTRRRRSKSIQNIVVDSLKSVSASTGMNNFTGTSNVELAMWHNVKSLGTVAHEFYMAMQALEGLKNSNYYALDNWSRVYNASLGIALCDTLTSPAFFKNFNLRLSKLYDGVRQDSGCPFKFTDMTVAHYKSHKIDPMTKTIIFSDSLNVEKAIEINEYCQGKIKCSFGIGTNFTNDIDDSKPLNMVIKLSEVDGFPVVKLGDDEGKETGREDAVRVAKWTLFGKSL